MIEPGDVMNRMEDAAIEPRDDARALPASDRFVSPSWLAHHWSVHPNTVYRDIRKRALRATRLPGGQYRVRLSDARRYGRPVE